MSRHRRRQLHRGWGRVEEYEVRDIANAVIAALAYRRDNGRIVVDVDETLHGQDREDAIQAALAPFREGQLVAGPLALIAAAGEAVLKLGAQSQKMAAAAAGTGAVAALGIATLVVTGAPEPGGHPAVVESILQTVIAEPQPPFATLFWTPAPTVRASTPNIRPSASTPPEAGNEPIARRPAGPRDASDESDRAPSSPPASRPSSTPHHPVERQEPESTVSEQPPKTRQPAQGQEEVAAGQEEPPPRQESRTPVDDVLPDVTVSVDPPPRPEPRPNPSGEGCGGIGVNVDLGKLGGANVCLLD